MADFVFLHNVGQGGWVWRDTVAALVVQSDEGFGRAVALDAPGRGTKRGSDVATMTMADVAAELVCDIEAAGMHDVVLIGHSQGGLALPFMAHQRPSLFSRLIYVTCFIPLPGQSVIEMMGTAQHGENDTEVGWPVDRTEVSVEQAFPLMFCNDMASDQAAAFASNSGQDMWPPLTYSMMDWCYEGVGIVPASYVLCLQDNILPVSWQETFAKRFAAERLWRIDAGHQVMNTRPHALAEFLRAVPQPAQ